ncbi:tyrosine-type recombinase/integrase [Nesterenkonia xinjiangensis]|uniref:Integrase n=1 Tax=Nesterenkonia xinjiangensis TaxID=225327 RepID=A0A7Z0K908_9MICC|nr:site-specific integrase [Nesterenkonia xinjiangensis]NYJ78259.1 integrase [Nesterenkonia xinjiangensis]
MPQRRNRRAGVEDLWRLSDGSPSKRDGQGLRWRARWVDPSGRERTKAFGRKVDAQRHVDSVTTALTTSTYVDPSAGRSTVGAAVRRYLDGFTGKPKTVSSYESVARSRIMPRWADVPLDAVIPSDISAWLADMQRGPEAVSAARARHAGLLLRQALDRAVDDRLIPLNPAARVKLPRAGKKRTGPRLGVDELHKVADQMPTATDRALFLTLATAGLRWGEAVALRVGAVEFDRQRITVSRTYVDIGGRITEDVPKSHAARWVPLAPALADELRPLLDGKPDDADVFTAPGGGVLRSGNWTTRALRPALRAAGCDDAMRVHDLRGTFASIAVQAGANIKALQRALGHESATLTLDTYADLYEDDLTGLGERINSAAYSLRTGGQEKDENPRPESL